MNKIQEEVATGVSGMEGKEEPMGKNKSMNRKNKKDCPVCGMKEKKDKLIDSMKARIREENKNGLKIKNIKDDTMKDSNIVVKEFYFSDDGYILFMEAGVLKHLVRTVRDSKGKLKRVKKKIFKAPKNSGMKVYRSGKIKRDATVKKNKILRKKELKKSKRTLRKGFSGKMRRANLLRKKTTRLNRGKV